MSKTDKHHCKTTSFKECLIRTYLTRLTPRSVPIITMEIYRWRIHNKNK